MENWYGNSMSKARSGCNDNSQFKYKTCCSESEESTSSSIGSSASSEDLLDDASSSSPEAEPHHFCSFPSTKIQLPIKRKGLSRYYQGKSKTFTALSDAKRVEDLAKKQIPSAKRSSHRSLSLYGKIIISKRNTSSLLVKRF